MRLWYVLLEERAPNTLAQVQRGPFEKVLQSKAERLPQILQCITSSRIACASTRSITPHSPTQAKNSVISHSVKLSNKYCRL